MVATINTTVSVAFSDMGCVGEVVLDESSGEDYDKYCIKVNSTTADGLMFQLHASRACTPRVIQPWGIMATHVCCRRAQLQ